LLHFDPVTKEGLLVAMYGEQADWYQNIRAHPALEVQIGRDHFVPVQRILPPEEAEAILTDFWHRYPRGVRLGLRLLGFHYDETEASKKALLSSLRVVSFRPKALLESRTTYLKEVSPALLSKGYTMCNVRGF
jgi:hypothetical protein